MVSPLRPSKGLDLPKSLSNSSNISSLGVFLTFSFSTKRGTWSIWLRSSSRSLNFNLFLFLCEVLDALHRDFNFEKAKFYFLLFLLDLPCDPLEFSWDNRRGGLFLFFLTMFLQLLLPSSFLIVMFLVTLLFLFCFPFFSHYFLLFFFNSRFLPFFNHFQHFIHVFIINIQIYSFDPKWPLQFAILPFTSYSSRRNAVQVNRILKITSRSFR